MLIKRNLEVFGFFNPYIPFMCYYNYLFKEATIQFRLLSSCGAIAAVIFLLVSRATYRENSWHLEKVGTTQIKVVV